MKLNGQNLRKWNVSDKRTEKSTTLGIWKLESVKVKTWRKWKWLNFSKIKSEPFQTPKQPTTDAEEGDARNKLKKAVVKIKEGVTSNQVDQKTTEQLF